MQHSEMICHTERGPQHNQNTSRIIAAAVKELPECIVMNALS